MRNHDMSTIHDNAAAVKPSCIRDLGEYEAAEGLAGGIGGLHFGGPGQAFRPPCMAIVTA